MTEEEQLRTLLAWAVSWIEDIHGVPMKDIEERDGINDASMWVSLHQAARWRGRHICTAGAPFQ